MKMAEVNFAYENFDKEFKEFHLNKIRKTIIAFANTEGGILYVEVADNGEIIGAENAGEIIQQIANDLKNNITPDIMPSTSMKTMVKDGKTVIMVSVEEGSYKPYYLREQGLKPSGVYVRIGDNNQQLNHENIHKMLVDNQGDSFEVTRSVQQELTFDVLAKHFTKINLPLEEAQMRALKLIGNDGLYTNLALLLSDQCEHTINVAIFQGMDKAVFRDRREFTGSLLKQLYEVYEFIDKHNKIKATFNDLDRIDTRDYPEEAIREVLLNCLVHREYSFSGKSLINIYDDRIEFISLGGLVPGLQLKTIFIGISQMRNPALAEVFYRLKLIESYGTGIVKILKSYISSRKIPEFIAVDGAFKVTLPNRNEESSSLVTILNEDGKPCDMQPQIILSDEEKVLQLASSQGYVTRKQVEELLQSKTTKAFNVLQQLCEQGKVEPVGVGKSRKYRIIN